MNEPYQLFAILDLTSSVELSNYYEKTCEFAKSINKYEGDHGLKTQIDFLRKCGDRIILSKDFAPHSFGFSVHKNGKFCFNGGIIYHGSHDRGGDGGAPTFSVSLTPVDGWSIHT